MGAYDDVGQGVLINLVRPDEGQKLSTQLTKPNYLVTFTTTRILKIYCQETTLRSQHLFAGVFSSFLDIPGEKNLSRFQELHLQKTKKRLKLQFTFPSYIILKLAF